MIVSFISPFLAVSRADLSSISNATQYAPQQQQQQQQYSQQYYQQQSVVTRACIGGWSAVCVCVCVYRVFLVFSSPPPFYANVHVVECGDEDGTGACLVTRTLVLLLALVF